MKASELYEKDKTAADVYKKLQQHNVELRSDHKGGVELSKPEMQRIDFELSSEQIRTMEGQWNNEPDKAHWIDEKTGLDCLISRNSMGSLCGYVGVPESHEYYKKHYDDVCVDVHGGLTFSEECQKTKDESLGICHPKQGCANEKVWWLGFDCAHFGDMSPLLFSFDDSTYKNFYYVKNEVARLAAQLVR